MSRDKVMSLTNALIVIKILSKSGGTSTPISTQLAPVLAHVSSCTLIVACNYNSIVHGISDFKTNNRGYIILKPGRSSFRLRNNKMLVIYRTKQNTIKHAKCIHAVLLKVLKLEDKTYRLHSKDLNHRSKHCSNMFPRILPTKH